VTTAGAPVASPVDALRPYLGLVPFTEHDQAYFFGRERDTELLVDNVIAFDVTLMYGPSGVGKSSIVSAGVVPTLLKRTTAADGHGPGDRIVPVPLRSWRDDPREWVSQALTDAAHGRGHPARPVSRQAPLWEQIAHWARACEADLCLVFDQFEEYFLYHGDPGDPFARELGEAVARDDVPAHYLFSIREDALATLDRLQERIPNLFDNIYRLEPLRLDEARRAVVGPIEEFNRRVGPDRHVSIEPGLVDDVLDQVRTGRLQIGPAGEGRIHESADRDEVELAHLQLVMDRLWHAEAAQASRVLRRDTLRRLGGADEIVRSHLDVSMAALSTHDRDLAARVFGQLVTPSGAKIAHRVDDLAAYADVPADELSPVLERLAEGDQRILRPVDRSADDPEAPRYEIFHDALGPAVLEWRTRHERAASERRARGQVAAAQAAARRERRRWMALVLVAVVLVGLLGTSLWLWWRSQQEASQRRSEQLASQAAAQIAGDPVAATRTALRAWDERHTTGAERALRLVAPRLHLLQGLSGHTDAVLDAEVSPDGHTILTTSDDQTARLWDAGTGDARATLAGHTGSVTAGQFSPDGQLVLTSSDDGSARLWSAATGELVETFDSEGDAVVDAALSPDGRRLATVHMSGTASLWDTGAGVEVVTALDPGEASATAVAFSPDSSTLATGHDDGVVRTWSAETGAPARARLDESPGGGEIGIVTDIAFNPAGDQLAIGNDIADLFIWRWHARPSESTVMNLWTAAVAVEWLDQVQFTPDGQHVIAVADKFGYLFPVPSGDEWDDPLYLPKPVPLGGHDDWATDIAVSPDGELVVTASRDGSALVRDARTGALLTELRGHTGAVNAVDIALDGRIVTASADGTARLWERPPTTVFRGYADWVLDAEVTPDQRQVIGAGKDGTIRVWDIATQEEVMQLTDGSDSFLGAVNLLAVSHDGRHVAAGTDYGDVRVWELAQPSAPIGAWSAGGPSISGLEFNATGSRLAIGTGDGVARVWAWTGDEPLPRLPAGTSAAIVAWSPVDGAMLATGASDGVIRLWDVRSAAVVAELPGHSSEVTDLAFTPGGSRLITAGKDGTARVWDVATRSLVRVLRGHEGGVTSVAFRDGGRQIVTGASDGTVAVWDRESGRYLALWRTHDDYVNAVAVLDDGRILSAGDDNLVRLYPCETCGPITGVVDDLRARLAALPPAAERAGDDRAGHHLPGTCLPTTSGQNDLYTIEPVPCEEPHDDEVFGNLELADPVDAELPADIHDRAVAACADRLFERYVGASPVDSPYRVSALTPTESSWDLGNRSVVCLLYDPTGPVTGSARGSGR
jgi:WD40 repeat protein